MMLINVTGRQESAVLPVLQNVQPELFAEHSDVRQLNHHQHLRTRYIEHTCALNTRKRSLGALLIEFFHYYAHVFKLVVVVVVVVVVAVVVVVVVL